MAFGGVLTPLTGAPVGEKGAHWTLRLLGLTLAAFVAAPPVPANADCGELTTSQTPGAGQLALPATFGKGPGRWVAGDVNLFFVNCCDRSNATQGAGGQLPLPHVAEGAPVTGDSPGIVFTVGPDGVHGDITIRIGNKGLQAVVQLEVQIVYMFSINR